MNISNMMLFCGQTPGTIYETSFTSRSDIPNGSCGRLKLGMRCALQPPNQNDVLVQIMNHDSVRQCL